MKRKAKLETKLPVSEILEEGDSEVVEMEIAENKSGFDIEHLENSVEDKAADKEKYDVKCFANEENIEVHLTLTMTYFSLGDTTRVFLSVDLDEDSDKSDVISLSSNSQEVISRYLNNIFFKNVIYV